jgi:serine/threonine-protein kinase
MACPGEDEVLNYLARTVSPAQRAAFEIHVDECSVCRKLLAELAHSTILDDIVGEIVAQAAPLALTRSSLDGGVQRYHLGESLGKGGMGEVWRATDARLERDVAIKRLLPELDDPRMIARFLREARVQGQLDHPAVVPIHDLDVDDAGRPFFAMQRVTGTTYDKLLALESPPRHHLLAKLVDACLAIELAHTRGIVHRDIKPSNLMLGDFGEIYVLDWGIAKVLDATDSDDDKHVDVDGTAIATRTGTQPGTPSYMAPEQARGDAPGPHVDVYQLGCVLYEILAGTRVPMPGARPSAAAEVPPELDDLCARALALAPSERPTARQLAEGLQTYLEGDRDLVRRRELATQCVKSAMAAITDPSDDARAAAMREAGRAIALDPDNVGARDLLGRLLLEAPRKIPDEAIAAADGMRARTRRKVVAWCCVVYFAVAAGLSLTLLFPRADTPKILGLVALEATIGLLCLYFGTRDTPLRTRAFWLLVGLDLAQLVVTCRLLGPLLVAGYFVGSIAAWLSIPTGRSPWIVVIGHVGAFVAMIALEIADILPSTFHITASVVTLSPPAFDLSPAATMLILGAGFVVQVASLALILIVMRRAQDEAQYRAYSHTWHLEQLLER